MNLVLRRLSQTAYATFGILTDADDKQLCVTLERPWLDNQHDISCIPAGTYPLVRYRSPKRGYDVWLLEQVPNRDMIEIHVGNVPIDTDGCVLVGSHFGETSKGYGIVDSHTAFDALMAATKHDATGTITVHDPVKATDTVATMREAA